MCVICGCSTSGHGTDVAPSPAAGNVVGMGPSHAPALGQQSGHEHVHQHIDPRDPDTLHYGRGPTQSCVPGLSEPRAIAIEADVLGANNRYAKANRHHFAMHGVHAYNLVSSPGSGKTTLLCATIDALRSQSPHYPVAVIEGDQQTSLDAERIRATGAPAIQVNTGRGCHLDARMVGEAFERLPGHVVAHGHPAGPAADHPTDPTAEHAHPSSDPNPSGAASGPSLLLIENVGNLVCPALWDLGERAKVVVLSVTEGEDKPLKYPDMFAAAHLMLINKIDLLPHVQFDVARCIAYARRVNPAMEVIEISATRGDGMADWLAWLQA